MSSENGNVAPETALDVAALAHERGKALRQEASALVRARNHAVIVAVELGRVPIREVAERLGISRQMVEHILGGHKGGSHPRAVSFTDDTLIELDRWVRGA